MRFIHVADTHIAADPQFVSFGHRPLANLEALVNAINSLAFPIDFVLHTGDVVEDRSEAAYGLARGILARLRPPIYYVAGNHDNGDLLQKVMLGTAAPAPRFDYRLDVGGVMVAVFDSRGPTNPAGSLDDMQMASLRALCTSDGPPLVIAIHHPPVPLDTPWLDKGWTVPNGRKPNMLLDRILDFQAAIAPARDRIRGVFFGHVHRAFQVMHGGILYASAPSSFGQLLSWPDQEKPEASPSEPGGFNVVTITGDTTIIRQHALERPGVIH